MTPAERWARVSPRRRAMITRAMLDRLDSTAGDDVEAAARYLEAEPDLQIAVRERLRAHEANRRAEAHKGRAALLAADVARLEALLSKAIDAAHDHHDPGDVAPDFSAAGALVQALHEADLYDAEEGEITPAGHALQLRAATTARMDPSPAAIGPCRGCGATTGQPCIPSCPDRPVPAPRPLRVYVAGGSSEVDAVAFWIKALSLNGVEITHDWTADVLAWRAAGSPSLTAEQRAAHARADLDGIERADLVWWILPAALSEGSAFEAGVAHGLAQARLKAEPPDTPFCDPGCECPTCLTQPHTEPRLVVSGDRAAHGRVFPELAAERWDSHDEALSSIVSLAAERRHGGAP